MKLNSGIQYCDISHQCEVIDGSSKDRPISLFRFTNVSLSGWDLCYPNILINERGSNNWFLPVRESFMSLGRDSNYESNPEWEPINQTHNPESISVVSRPVFFFGYNLINFYHFMYDTLPYLNGYLHMKSKGTSCMLLVGATSSGSVPQYVHETLVNLDINPNTDILTASSRLLIKELYVSCSYTHDGKSLDPPHPNHNKPLSLAVQNIKSIMASRNESTLHPKLSYISRRTWASKDTSNIGTNFTEHRKFCNEDELVLSLSSLGFTEVFMECLSLQQKIEILENSQIIVAASGGGLANLLLAPSNLKVILINSPQFWEINKRLRFAFNHVRIIDFDNTEFAEYNNPLIGGIEFISVQGGLNSPWRAHLPSLISLIKEEMHANH